MVDPSIHHHNRNGLYLLASITMIFMTLAIAIQPLYLRNVIGIPFENAGAINANIQVVTELLDLLLIGYLFDAIGPHEPFVATGVANLLIMSYALWVLGAKMRRYDHHDDPSIATEDT